MISHYLESAPSSTWQKYQTALFCNLIFYQLFEAFIQIFCTYVLFVTTSQKRKKLASTFMLPKLLVLMEGARDNFISSYKIDLIL